MKVRFVILLMRIILCGCNSAGSMYLLQSNIDPNKQVIYRAGGKEEGFLQQSEIDPRRTVPYNILHQAMFQIADVNEKLVSNID
jgi:hypothetical protein